MVWWLLQFITRLDDRLLALLPLAPPLMLLIPLIDNPVAIVQGWIDHAFLHSMGHPTITSSSSSNSSNDDNDHLPSEPQPSVASQLLAYMTVALFGFIATNQLVPSIQTYTLQKGICGKDLGKKGTAREDVAIPEALGIVPGAVFLVCLIFCLVGYATSHPPSKLLDVNSALLSICFMLFLGFTDDVLDWPWRYKLFLPSVASLPLLCCYNGSTSIVVPIQLRPLLWQQEQEGGGGATALAHVLGMLPSVVVDAHADGAVLETGYFYLLYMGMLAVFCTNAINIYAGINGLEAGQAYVIACAVLVHNCVEIAAGRLETNHLFSVMLITSFAAVTAGLLRHNWYPSRVFVGDTFCYFAGMTFAVVAILGHFSKTLLLFFIPQVVNFCWSCPQLFRFVPCPRHRLPKFQASLGKMVPSTFPCAAQEYTWIKVHKNDTECPNMTLICLVLQWWGPMTERELCIVLLLLQGVSCAFGLFCRYYLAQLIFDN